MTDKQNHVGPPRKDRFGRERRPQQYLYGDDGELIATGAEAIAAVTGVPAP